MCVCVFVCVCVCVCVCMSVCVCVYACVCDDGTASPHLQSPPLCLKISNKMKKSLMHLVVIFNCPNSLKISYANGRVSVRIFYKNNSISVSVFLRYLRPLKIYFSWNDCNTNKIIECCLLCVLSCCLFYQLRIVFITLTISTSFHKLSAFQTFAILPCKKRLAIIKSDIVSVPLFIVVF